MKPVRHDGLSALQAKLLIVSIVATVIGMAFDDDGQIAALFEPLGGEVNLALAQVSQISRVEIKRHRGKNQTFDLDDSFPELE